MFREVLSRLSRDSARIFATGEGVRLIPTGSQERPFSHLLRVRVCREDEEVPLSHLFVKIFKDKLVDGDPEGMRRRVVRDYATTQRAHALLAPSVRLGAVRPIACYPDLLAIATEESPGITLLQYLQEQISWFPAQRKSDAVHETMSSVGHWIRAFQGMPVPEGRPRVDDIQSYIETRLNRLVHDATRPFTSAYRARVLSHIKCLRTELTAADVRPVMSHSDLSLGNFLIDGDRVIVLDFAMAGPANWLYDVTKVFFQLELLTVKPQFRKSVIQSLQAALLGGFEPSLRNDLPAFRLMLLLHRVNHLSGLGVSRGGLLSRSYNAAVRHQHAMLLRREMESS